MANHKALLLAMPKEEILRGADLALRNVEGLLHEGRIHATQPGRLHIANALFQFAVEEVGKALVLCEHYRNLFLGLPVDVDSLWRAFSSHGHKTRKSLSMLEEVFKRAEGEYSEGLSLIQEAIRTASQYESVRQQSLYVDFDGNGFQAPRDIITLPIVEHTLLISNTAFNFAHEYHMTLVDPSYTFLSRTNARIRQAGGPVSPAAVLQRLKKP